MSVCAIIDGIGVYGNFLHYALVITLVGSSFLIFIYLWKNNQLNMDEEPKFQMMEEIETGKSECLIKEKKE